MKKIIIIFLCLLLASIAVAGGMHTRLGTNLSNRIASLKLFDLFADFTAANQTFSNAQALDTAAEGVQKGSMTVVDVAAGTDKIASNLLEITGTG